MNYNFLTVATDPTADRTITFPDETGTVLTTGSGSFVTSAMIVQVNSYTLSNVLIV